MQYLKDDVRDQIVKSALAEFLEKGYHDASMRSISLRSKYAIGTIYRYFESKEAIFNYSVGSVYDQMLKFVEKLQQEISDSKVSYKNFQSMKLITEICNDMLDLFFKHSTEILILVDKSEGTRFENVYQDTVKINYRILKEVFLAEIEKEGKKVPDVSILEAISASYTAGFYYILKHNTDPEKIKALTHSFLVATFHDLSYALTEADSIELFPESPNV
jgi:Transcriptional regulator